MVSPELEDNYPNKNYPREGESHAKNLGALSLGGNQSARYDFLNNFTLEQKDYAEAITTGMVETLGLDPEEIQLIAVKSEKDTRVFLMDASPNGQFIGLYRDILAKREADPDWYTLKVNGERVDPLEGCTRESYEAMIADARARGERYLPDSLALNQHNGHVWTATMMTGEPLASEGRIWIGSSSSYDKVNFVDNPIDRGGKSFRVRPTIEIAQLEG